jgi:hypothetical protein
MRSGDNFTLFYFTRPPQALSHPPATSLPGQATVPWEAPPPEFTRQPHITPEPTLEFAKTNSFSLGLLDPER